MNVFVDTSAFYAILSRMDANHANATIQWRTFLTDQTYRLFTSNYIVVETCALVKNRLGLAAVTDFTQALLPVTTVLWVDEPAHFAALETMLATGTHGPSLVDASSFAIMDAHGIHRAFAYDRHFSARGF
jgi:predicted nucleic acid-binding protein